MLNSNVIQSGSDSKVVLVIVAVTQETQGLCLAHVLTLWQETAPHQGLVLGQNCPDPHPARFPADWPGCYWFQDLIVESDLCVVVDLSHIEQSLLEYFCVEKFASVKRQFPHANEFPTAKADSNWTVCLLHVCLLPENVFDAWAWRNRTCSFDVWTCQRWGLEVSGRLWSGRAPSSPLFLRLNIQS